MQNKKFHQMIARSLFFVFLGMTAFAFGNRGGDSYEIYLNNKLLVKQFVTQSLALQSLSLSKANDKDHLTIYYKHCGRTGKGRSIALKDGKGKTLRQWQFTDADGAMTIAVHDLLSFMNKADGDLSVFYSSQELPKGRLLASLNTGAKGAAVYHDAKMYRYPGIFI
jgi:hypothetical protein